jgi:peptidoglycan/xylan/chitin deacetylase (PgdA/CDA1 family)
MMAARKPFLPTVLALAALAAAACSGPDAVIFTNSMLAAGAAGDPAVMRAVDGIPGWKRQGPPERFNAEGLYGHIDGGAELVLQYGFRELSVFKYKPESNPAASKEVVLEIYRMTSGEAAFGLYSTKLEGGEEGWPGVKADNWISPGQANLVKGDYLVNIMAPECTDREIGEFAAALENKIPGTRTVRPKGLAWLPAEGMVPSSGRYIKGPLAAGNESPFLEGDFWGFDGDPAKSATAAYSAKYGVAPAVSKLVIVEMKKAPQGGSFDERVLASFNEYLMDVRPDGAVIEGRNQAGRWFLFGRRGAIAVLVLGDPDREAAQARLDQALSRASGKPVAPAVDKPKTYLVVTFDTEDYVTPEAEKIDDIPKWLAETMTEEGVTGTFFVIGEKARSLEKRGRRDVIAAMARHDIGSHTNFGSIHPTVTEELEKAGWDDGVRLMREQESAGIEELERIFGVPVTTLARHGGSYGPQLVYALGRIRAGYQGSPAKLPGHDVVWFCNALNFSAQVAGFDDAYYRDDLFDPVFDRLKMELPERIRGSGVLALFAGHPTKIRAEEFWDLNFYYGKNTPPDEWRTPRLRPRETMVTARKNFRRMMRWLKGRDDIEITTYRTLMDVYGVQKGTMTRDELRAIAAAALKARALVPTADFSPAEAFSGLARALAGYQEGGDLPEILETLRPLGPMEMPPAGSGNASIARDDVFALARAANEHIARTGSLPPSLEIGGAPIGTGSLFALFSAVYLDLDSGRARPAYDALDFEPYPRTNEKGIVEEVEGFKTWPVHRLDLDMSRIVELTRLQLWTLKPARRR